MKKINTLAAFTLIELLVIVAIFSAVASIAAPSFSDLIHSQKRHAAVADLVGLFNTARTTAIEEQTAVTVCPLNPSGVCTNEWSQAITAFRDPERTRQVSHDSQIIRLITAAAPGKRVGSTGLFNFLAFRATGRANAHIGNVLWCPPDGSADKAAQVVVNWGGRVRVARDNDGDGVIENADGTPVNCP